MNTIGAWLDQVVEANTEAIRDAAAVIATCLERGGMVYTAGSGHSLAMVMETFFRAGGLARIRPIHSDALFPLAGALSATGAEREVGLGRRVTAALPITAADVVVVFSHSGRNPYPVEVAQEARTRGATVVAFTSVAASSAGDPRTASWLHQVADIVVDTHAPPGDVSWPEQDPVTRPLSTISGALLWGEVLTEVVAMDPRVQLWRSANQDGNDAVNARIIAELRERVPELGC